MYLFDTNIFLRFFVRETKKTYQDSKLALFLVKKGKIKALTAGFVLAEIEWTLKSYYDIRKKDRIEYLGSIIKLFKNKIAKEVDFPFALDLYQKHSVKFIDCLIASIPRVQKGKVCVVSYDTDFDKLGVRRLTPTELLDKIK